MLWLTLLICLPHETLPVSLDRSIETHVEGVANQGVADAHLVEPGYATVELMQVDEAEVVARVEPESRLAGSHGRVNERADGLRAAGGVA